MIGRDHLSFECILEYFTGQLDHYELEMIENHLGECAACAAMARRAYSLTEGWTPGLHAASIAAEARAADPLVRALTAAKALYGGLEAKLQAWLNSQEALWRLPDIPVAEFKALAVRGTAEPLIAVDFHAGILRARVVVSARPHTVEVRLPAQRAVILFGDESEAPLIMASTGPVARFEKLPPGEYYLAVEPADQ
jgi:hypothetical protein